MIGSQALIAEPRATVPSPTGRARVADEAVGDADDRPPDRRRRPDRADRRLRRGQAEPVDELGLLVRPQEQVDRRIAAAQPGTIRLPDRAAGQHDPQPGVRGLELGELALPADDLLLGALADRTGVDDDEVGVLEATAPPRSPPRAGARPSPRNRCGSSGSRASRRGSAAGRASSGRYSAQPLVGRRRRTARSGSARRGATRSRTGSARVVVMRVSVTAAPWYAEAWRLTGILGSWTRAC